MRTPKMYVLVRRDLDNTYRCVQGSHALAQFALEHPEKFKLWNNSTIVFLGVHNLNDLREWYEKVGGDGTPCSIFNEPDLDNQPTALAYYGCGESFKNLRLA